MDDVCGFYVVPYAHVPFPVERAGVVSGDRWHGRRGGISPEGRAVGGERNISKGDNNQAGCISG